MQPLQALLPGFCRSTCEMGLISELIITDSSPSGDLMLQCCNSLRLPRTAYAFRLACAFGPAALPNQARWMRV